MDKLVPPPNGSPEEIEAWNNMMDTMVTFIRASTNLMNTITLKVRPVPGGPGIASNLTSLMESCEPECDMCIPKPKTPCGVCTKKPARRSLTDQGAAKAPSTPSSKVQVVTPPIEGDGKVEAPAEEAEAEEESAPPVEEEPPPPVEEEEPAPPTDVEESAPPVEEEKPAPSEPTEVPAGPDQPAGATDTGCVCSAIRAKKLEDSQKAAEDAENFEAEQPPQEPLEHLCACGPTEGNHASMVQDMVQKLANAQQEIELLQEEMMKLQRMDATRKTALGGPNPAALYREIMRNNEVQDPCPRDRSSQQRISQQVRPRFQTQNPGLDCSQCPGNRSMSNQSRRRFQTNNTNGFDNNMSIPAEGMQLPEGFVGNIIPCENSQIGSNYAISQAMPRQMQRQGSMQAAMQQQRSMYMSMQQQNMAASRQGMLNRTGSQGGANQIPARRNGGPGSNTGFRGYQDSPNAGGASGFRTLQNFPDPPDSSSRRIMMCGPPPQPQSGGCNSCQNR